MNRPRCYHTNEKIDSLKLFYASQAIETFSIVIFISLAILLQPSSDFPSFAAILFHLFFSSFKISSFKSFRCQLADAKMQRYVLVREFFDKPL